MRIDRPRGFVPRSKGCNLPPDYAVCAENLNQSTGRFEPWRSPVPLISFKEPVRVAHLSHCCWTGTDLCGAKYVDAGLDTKTYLSAPERRPLVTDDICCPDWCFLGYPVPDPIQLYPDPESTVDKGPDAQSRTYRITYGTDCEEGPASCPSEALVGDKNSRVGLLLPSPPDQAWCATHVNIYRSESLWDPSTGLYSTQISDLEGGYTSTSTDQDYFLVAQVPISTRAWIDQSTECEGKLLTTADLLPPREGSQVAGETQSGSLVIWNDRTLWFSERNKYWGFPLKTAHDFPEPIRNVLVCLDLVYVLTCSEVYLLSDEVDCRESTIRVPRLVKDAPGVSDDTCVSELSSGVLYSSDAGLVHVRPDRSYRLVSDPAFGRDDWHSLGPIRAVTITNQNVILSTDQREYVWVLSLDENGYLPPDLTTLSFRVDQWIVGANDNRLYFLVNNEVYEFNIGADYMDMDWWQAEQVSSQRDRISAVKADYVKKNGQNKNKISVYRDGNLSVDKILTDKGGRIRASASRCNQIRVRGNEPMCSVSYGQGLNNVDRGDQQ